MFWFLAILSLMLWFLLTVAAGKTCRRVPALPEAEAGDETLISVICPARDEAEALEEALRSRLADPSPHLEFILVNDRSRDDTGAIMDAIALEDSRVQVIHLDTLPEGWLGKVHAQSAGAEAARGDWLLFSDADVHVQEGLVHRARSWAQHQEADHVALVPRLVGGPLLLRMALPAMMLVLMSALRLWRTNDDESDAAMGVGAFNLVSRRALEGAGGMKALRMEIADDVGLGLIIKEAGYRSRLAVAPEALQVEWYRSTRDFLAGMEKGAAKAGGRSRLAWRAFLFLGLGLLLVSPLGLVALGGSIMIPAMVTLAMAIFSTVMPAWRFALPMGWAVLFPVTILTAMAVAQRSLWLACLRGRIRWRGDDHGLESTRRGERVRL